MANIKDFDLKLEQVFLNEATMKQELTEQDKLYIKNIEVDNADFFKKFNVKDLVEKTEEKLEKEKNIIKFPIKTITTLAAAAACFIFALNIIPQNSNLDKEIIYLKGAQDLSIYLKDSETVNELKEFDKVHLNDQLQISYKSNENYGVIFSIDGLSNITFHYPEKDFSSTNLEIGKEVNLPTSYTLDNAPHFEKFYMITAKGSFDISLIKSEISKINITDGVITKDINLPKKYNIESITLIKE